MYNCTLRFCMKQDLEEEQKNRHVIIRKFKWRVKVKEIQVKEKIGR